jgi:uncharacterized membrane protein
MAVKIKMELTTVISLLMLIAGIIFYFGWSLYYDAWTNIGVYSLTIVLVMFGVLGLLLSMTHEGGEPQEKRKK